MDDGYCGSGVDMSGIRIHYMDGSSESYSDVYYINREYQYVEVRDREPPYSKSYIPLHAIKRIQVVP